MTEKKIVATMKVDENIELIIAEDPNGEKWVRYNELSLFFKKMMKEVEKAEKFVLDIEDNIFKVKYPNVIKIKTSS